MSKKESATPNRFNFIIIGCVAEFFEKLAKYLEWMEYCGRIKNIIMMARKKAFTICNFFLQLF